MIHSPARRPTSRFVAALFAGLALIFTTAGCELVGGMAASYQRYEEVDISAEYRGLDGQTVAILIDAPLDIQYSYPGAVPMLTDLITLGVARHCPGARVLATREALSYQASNAHWAMEDYGKLAGDLGVTRLVLIDLVEYRLFEPGNSYVWDGAAVADVNVFEADGASPTDYAFSRRIIAQHPPVRGVNRDQESQANIEQGLQLVFARNVVRLFHDHKVIRDELIKEAQRR